MLESFISLAGPLLFFASSLVASLYMGRRLNKVHTIPHAPLIDVLHTDSLRFMHKYYTVSDYLINGMVAIVVLFFNEHLSTYFTLLGVMYYTRIFTFSFTILPKPGLMTHKNVEESIFGLIKNNFTGKDVHTGFNNDLIFSGHTGILSMTSMYMTYFYPTHILLNTAMWLSTIGASFLIIISRCHYTVDVQLAYVVTLCIFQNLVVLPSRECV